MAFLALFLKNTIKNTGSNFQHPLAHARGHWRSCSLNRNEAGDAIETTRHTFFDNETIFVVVVVFALVLVAFTHNSKEKLSQAKFS